MMICLPPSTSLSETSGFWAGRLKLLAEGTSPFFILRRKLEKYILGCEKHLETG